MTRTLSIVVPCYNEEPVIEQTHERLAQTLEQLRTVRGIVSEIIYVNDGSAIERSIFFIPSRTAPKP